MYVAVLIPPLRLFRLGGKSRHDALRLFLHLLLHLGLSRKAFLSETLAGKALMARTLPLRIVHATDNRRPPFVRPTERYRSSLSINSKFRSTGSLFSNCSNSAGATLWRPGVSCSHHPTRIRFRWPAPMLYRSVYTFQDWLPPAFTGGATLRVQSFAPPSRLGCDRAEQRASFSQGRDHRQAIIVDHQAGFQLRAPDVVRPPPIDLA
jgi:hypothetical protein